MVKKLTTLAVGSTWPSFQQPDFDTQPYRLATHLPQCESHMASTLRDHALPRSREEAPHTANPTGGTHPVHTHIYPAPFQGHSPNHSTPIRYPAQHPCHHTSQYHSNQHHRSLPHCTENTQNASPYPTANDAQNKYLQQLVDKLQNANLKQSDELSDLKIKFAIQGKELQYATKARDDADKSLQAVIRAFTDINSHQTLGGGADFISHPVNQSVTAKTEVDQNIAIKLKNAEHEIELLRQKNTHLTKELKSKEKFPSREVNLSGVAIPDEQAYHLRSTSTIKKQITQKHGLNQSQTPAYLQKSLASQKLPENILDDLENPDSAPLAQILKQAQNTEHPTQTILEHDRKLNIGLPTFDEIMDDSDDDDDEEVQLKRREREAFYNPPAPTVLKTGFEGIKTFDDKVENTINGQTSFSRNRIGEHLLEAHPYNHHTPIASQQQRPRLAGSRVAYDESESDEPLDEQLKDNPFKNCEELNLAIKSQRMACASSKIERIRPDIFEHGLQYRPTDDDTNIFRTVMMTGLPKDIQSGDVVARVRGGDLMSATLCDSVSIIGSMSCRLVFQREAAAVAYAEFCTKHTLTFSPTQKGIHDFVSCDIVETPTYPMQGRQHTRSRCLYIPAFPNTLSIQELVSNIACGNDLRAQSLIGMWMDENRCLFLHFTSVLIASSAFGILSRWEEYRNAGVQPYYDEDPCSGPLEDLLGSPAPNQPMFPNDQLKLEYSEDQVRARRTSFDQQHRTFDGRELRFNTRPQSSFSRRRLISYRDIDAVGEPDVVLSYDSQEDSVDQLKDSITQCLTNNRALNSTSPLHEEKKRPIEETIGYSTPQNLVKGSIDAIISNPETLVSSRVGGNKLNPDEIELDLDSDSDELGHTLVQDDEQGLEKE